MIKSEDVRALKMILDAIQWVKIFMEGKEFEELEENYIFRLAMERMIEIVGETARYRVSGELKERTKEEIPWEKIIGMRIWMAHIYHEIKLREIWETVAGSGSREDIYDLEKKIRELLQREGIKYEFDKEFYF